MPDHQFFHHSHNLPTRYYEHLLNYTLQRSIEGEKMERRMGIKKNITAPIKSTVNIRKSESGNSNLSTRQVCLNKLRCEKDKLISDSPLKT